MVSQNYHSRRQSRCRMKIKSQTRRIGMTERESSFVHPKIGPEHHIHMPNVSTKSMMY